MNYDCVYTSCKMLAEPGYQYCALHARRLAILARCELCGTKIFADEPWDHGCDGGE